MHVYEYANVCMCANVCVRVNVCTCVCACVRACVCVCMHVRGLVWGENLVFVFVSLNNVYSSTVILS